MSVTAQRPAPKNGRKKGLKGLFCELTQLLENIGIEPYAIKIALSGRTLPAMPGRSKAALREGALAPSKCSTGARARLGHSSSKQKRSPIHTYSCLLQGPYGHRTLEGLDAALILKLLGFKSQKVLKSKLPRGGFDFRTFGSRIP